MKYIRILPIAVATALFAIGGATTAFADPASHGDRDFVPPAYSTSATLQLASATKTASATPLPAAKVSLPGTSWVPNDRIPLGQAEKLAIKKVGGTVTRIMFYGPGDHHYAFDLKNGNKMHRVYVNGQTGRVKVAINMDPSMDPAIIGGSNSRGSDFLSTQMSASYR